MAAWLGRRRNASASHPPAPAVELSVADAYAAWAPHYPPSPHTALMHAEQRAMLALLPEVTGAVVLDAACGTGRYLELMVARGARYAIGVDASPHMLRRVRAGA